MTPAEIVTEWNASHPRGTLVRVKATGMHGTTASTAYLGLAGVPAVGVERRGVTRWYALDELDVQS